MPDDELSRVTRLLQEGTFEDAVAFLDCFANDDVVDGRLEKRLFGRRKQHLLHVVAEVGSVEFMEYLVTRQAAKIAKEKAKWKRRKENDYGFEIQ